MKNLSFKKRIATYFMLATALVVLLVFGTVYFIVQQTVYNNLDSDLSFEAEKHLNEVFPKKDSVFFKNMNEWKEIEHREIQVNPVFIQLVDMKGRVNDKSPNLKESHLKFRKEYINSDHFNALLNERNIRQVQIPIVINGKTKGYIVAAMSLDASLMVLENLQTTLFILFPIVLIGLFFITSFLAGRSIIPVLNISETTHRITRNNLNERVELPVSKDELYDLSSSFNSLLDRIQDAMNRERQFTSDASHELRTPLSVLRGTLEVLIRKPRTQEEYEEKIKYSLTEIDHMAKIIDHLLEIARFDANPDLNDNSKISAEALIQEIISHRKIETVSKNVNIQLSANHDGFVHQFYAYLIMDNIISNAIKYAYPNSQIQIELSRTDSALKCVVSDNGIGIKQEDLMKIFTPFFRSDSLEHKEIGGSGLGLSIVQKAASAINAEVQIQSELSKGTSVTIYFKEILRQS